MAWKLSGKPAPPPEEKPVWSSYELAEYLGLHPNVVIRWVRDWFPDVKVGSGPGHGYKIPASYLPLARFYLLAQQTNDIRSLVRPVLVADPRDWVVVVDGNVTTHYTREEVATELRKVQHLGQVVYVGEFLERMESGRRAG